MKSYVLNMPTLLQTKSLREDTALNKLVKTKDLFDCQTPYLKDFFAKFEYPWEMLPEIKNHIKDLIAGGLDGFTEIAEGVQQVLQEVMCTVTVKVPDHGE